jgi:hypothetical protein
MFDPSVVTLGQVSSTVRDLSIVVAVISAVWKARGMYEVVTDFFERTTSHMDKMEAGMDKLLTNHLAHIEASVEKMAHRQVRASDVERSQYKKEDELE